MPATAPDAAASRPEETVQPDDDLTPEQLAAQWEDEAPDPAGPWANLSASLVVLALGIAGILISIGLGVGSPSNPDPGTWPLAVCVIICVLAAVQLIIGRRGGTDGEQFSRYSALPLIGLLTLFGMVALVPIIGFEIPALALCIIWMKFLGGESWRSTAIYSVLIVVAFYVIFISALGTSIPHLV